MNKAAVIGAGAWGTTLALLFSQNDHNVCVWSYEKEVVVDFEKTRENIKYLPGIKLPKNVSFSSDLKETLTDSDLILFSVPTQHLKNIVKEAAAWIKEETLILCAAKGIEVESLKLPSEILSGHLKNNIAAISGPNLAKEIALGLPAASVIASDIEDFAKEAQLFFGKCKTFRIYTSDDLKGVQIGGALKNVIAIAAGALDGKNLGDNAKSALIVRGIAEITRLGVKMGAQPQTFSGLSGLGDLITTCQSGLSRNHAVGFRMAKGESLEQILKDKKDVAEGVPTTKAAMKLSEKHKIEMPITTEVYKALFEKKNIDKALIDLMERPSKSED